MRLDSSGNLGLGVTPSAVSASDRVLQVRNFLFNDNTNGYGIIRYNNYFNGTQDTYLNTGAVSAFQMQGNAFKWYQAPSGTAGNAITFTQAMTLDASGNLGVGTTSPAAKLDVNGTIYSRTGGVYTDSITAYSGSSISINAGSSNLNIVVNGAERARIDSSGNLLIGTTTSSSKLTLDGIQTYRDGADSRVGTIKFASGGFNVTSAETELNLVTPYSSVVFLTGTAGTASERARIDSSGNLLVGATSGESTIIQKNTNTARATTRVISACATTGNQFGLAVELNGDPNNADQYIFAGRGGVGGSTDRCIIRSNGGIANYQANNVNLSDRREKTNFAPAGSYLAKICAIPVQTFNYIDQNMEDDGGLTLGVVAQDVQAVAPEMVMESNWGTQEDPKMRLSIYQTDLQYALMKALQELKAEFDAYKASHP
jgi:hypothetical protein